MYFDKKSQFDWAFGLGCCDALSLLLSLGLVRWLQAASFLPGMALGPRASLLFVLVAAWMLRNSNLYTWQAFTRKRATLLGLCRALVLAAAAVAGIRLFFFRGHDREAALTLEWLALFSLAILGGVRWLYRQLTTRCLRLVAMQRVAFAGWSPHLRKVIEAYRGEMGSFHVLLGFFRGRDAAAHDEAVAAGYACLGTLELVETMIEREKVTLMLIDKQGLKTEDVMQIVEICSRHFVNVRIIPQGYAVLATKFTVRAVAGVPVINIRGLAFEHLQNRLLKRLVDLVGAVVGLLLFAPVIAVAGLLIYRESPGPIFYRQVRLGLREEPFRIVKLRSMRLDAEQSSGATWAVEGDPRRLRIGAFLRRTNLDEVPQFWTILMGEMSLVGPRPERPEFTSHFRENVPHYNLRHICRPGLTGWAAVNGFRGNTSLPERLRYDIYYIENWSLLFDFKILFLTLFRLKNAY